MRRRLAARFGQMNAAARAGEVDIEARTEAANKSYDQIEEDQLSVFSCQFFSCQFGLQLSVFSCQLYSCQALADRAITGLRGLPRIKSAAGMRFFPDQLEQFQRALYPSQWRRHRRHHLLAARSTGRAAHLRVMPKGRVGTGPRLETAEAIQISRAVKKPNPPVFLNGGGAAESSCGRG